MANTVITPSALTATVIAVCTAERMAETSAELASLREGSGVRTILISLGNDPQPPIRAEHDVISIAELLPRYLNNAVASLRLSSLPSVAWWRGGDVGLLPDLAELVDRLVLDAEHPHDAWTRLPQIASLTMVSDLRWTQLTRWRNLMAQFFDVPEVRSTIDSFSHLEVAGSDPHAARLFAGWLRTVLPVGRSLTFDASSGTRSTRSLRLPDGPIQVISLAGPSHRLELRLAATSACIHTSVISGGSAIVSRSVPLGQQVPHALMTQELRIRARDYAFEQAVEAAGALP